MNKPIIKYKISIAIILSALTSLSHVKSLNVMPNSLPESRPRNVHVVLIGISFTVLKIYSIVPYVKSMIAHSFKLPVLNFCSTIVCTLSPLV